jgi:uncharacterized Zn-finger protein
MNRAQAQNQSEDNNIMNFLGFYYKELIDGLMSKPTDQVKNEEQNHQIPELRKRSSIDSEDLNLNLEKLSKEDINKSSSSRRDSITMNPKKKAKFFKCTFQNCEMVFPKQCILRDHERAHRGEKPFQCSFKDCNKSFTQLGNLKMHEKSHNKGSIYYCDFPNCNKGFTANSYLNVFLYLLLKDS